MLGSPCNPCCGLSCEQSLAWIRSRPFSVVVSGSTPGSDAYTVLLQNPNEDWMRLKQGQRWRQLYTAKISPGSVVITPLTHEQQAAAIAPYAVYTAEYTRTGTSADGTHDLSLSLASPAGTALFLKTTSDYIITARVVLNGPPPHVTIPGVACPVSVNIQVEQQASSGTGALSPAMLSKSASIPFVIPADFFNAQNAEFTQTVYPYVKWPDSPYVRLADFPRPDGSYDFLAMRGVYEGDLSSQNVAMNVSSIFIGGVMESRFSPGSAQLVTFTSRRISNFDGTTPSIAGVSAGKVTVNVAGSLYPFPGVGKWVDGVSGNLRQPINGDNIVFSQVTYNTFGATIAAPPLASRQLVSRYMDNMQVSAIIEHP